MNPWTILKDRFYYRITLLICVLIGFSIRVWQLQSIPTGLFADEASTGYNAYSVLHTGKDEFGTAYPLFFKSFDNWRPGLPFYLTMPVIAIFGLNEFSTRFPSVLIGTLTIIVIASLTKLLLKDSIAAIFSAMTLSLSPWSIHFSRYGDGLIYIPFFAALSLVLALLALQKKSYILWSCMGLSACLGIYTYYQAYYLLPLLFIVTLFYAIFHANDRMNTYIYIACATFIIFYIPMYTEAMNGHLLSRFSQIMRTQTDLSIVDVLSTATKTYLQHFGIPFLFQSGDIGHITHFITRFSVKHMGQLYWIQLPFIVMGIFSIRFKKTARFFLGLLVILYPIGSTIALHSDGGGPFATRSILGILPFHMLTGAGISWLVRYVYDTYSAHVANSILYSTGLLYLFSFIIWVYAYFIASPIYSSNFWGWQYGPRDIMNYAISRRTSFDDLLILANFNGADIFLKFYDPKGLCKSACRFASTANINANRKQLIVVSPSRIKELQMYRYATEHTLFYPNGLEAFSFIRIHGLATIQFCPNTF